MADSVQFAVSVTFTDGDLQQTKRLMDETDAHEPVSHESGEANIPAQTSDLEIATNVNLFSMKADSAISLKIGNTTNPEHTNMNAFVYDGSPTSIFVSNPGTESIKMRYASSKFA